MPLPTPFRCRRPIAPTSAGGAPGPSCIVGISTKKIVIAIASINHIVAKAAHDLVVAIPVSQG
ncbi:MAG TPA: hypothetical protein VF501_10700, partial [Thiobacillus sp.]